MVKSKDSPGGSHKSCAALSLCTLQTFDLSNQLLRVNVLLVWLASSRKYLGNSRRGVGPSPASVGLAANSCALNAHHRIRSVERGACT
eukprot:1827683-Amphidinium_carterae.1